MDKKTLLSEIDKTISHVETVINVEHKEGLRGFINDLERLKLNIFDKEIKSNPIRGFARRYAEMYSDYLNPITDVLDRMEKTVDLYLEKEI